MCIFVSPVGPFQPLNSPGFDLDLLASISEIHHTHLDVNLIWSTQACIKVPLSLIKC